MKINGNDKKLTSVIGKYCEIPYLCTLNFTNMKNLKAALFDLDGTLIDTENQYTVIWGNIARRLRPDIPGLEYMIKGTTLVQIFEKYFPDPNDQQQVKEMLNEGESHMSYEFYPGALNFIDDLKRHGVKCAIVTSSDKNKMSCVERAIPNFYDLFDRVLTAEDFTASKPAPDCYLQGARVFGCSIDECVVFEDAFTGLQAGTSAGIFTIGLSTVNSAEAIKDKCDYVLDGYVGFNYDKLMEILSSQRSK